MWILFEEKFVSGLLCCLILLLMLLPIYLTRAMLRDEKSNSVYIRCNGFCLNTFSLKIEITPPLLKANQWRTDPLQTERQNHQPQPPTLLVSVSWFTNVWRTFYVSTLYTDWSSQLIISVGFCFMFNFQGFDFLFFQLRFQPMFLHHLARPIVQNRAK